MSASTLRSNLGLEPLDPVPDCGNSLISRVLEQLNQRPLDFHSMSDVPNTGEFRNLVAKNYLLEIKTDFEECANDTESIKALLDKKNDRVFVKIKKAPEKGEIAEYELVLIDADCPIPSIRQQFLLYPSDHFLIPNCAPMPHSTIVIKRTKTFRRASLLNLVNELLPFCFAKEYDDTLWILINMAVNNRRETKAINYHDQITALPFAIGGIPFNIKMNTPKDGLAAQVKPFEPVHYTDLTLNRLCAALLLWLTSNPERARAIENSPYMDHFVIDHEDLDKLRFLLHHGVQYLWSDVSSTQDKTLVLLACLAMDFMYKLKTYKQAQSEDFNQNQEYTLTKFLKSFKILGKAEIKKLPEYYILTKKLVRFRDKDEVHRFVCSNYEKLLTYAQHVKVRHNEIGPEMDTDDEDDVEGFEI